MTKNEKNKEVPTTHSVESEEAVLGAVLLNNHCLTEVIREIEPDDFCIGRHKIIYQHMQRMYEAKVPIDVLTIQEALKESGKLVVCGGPVYIDQLYDRVPASENAPYYARVIKKFSKRRKLMTFAKQVWEEANKSEDVDASINSMVSDAIRIAQEQRFQHVRAFDETIPEYREKYYRRIQDPASVPIGYPSGFNGLDKYIGLLREDCLTVISARPKAGKTAFAINCALNIARQGGAVLFISLEMSFGSLVNRMLANQTGLDSFYIDMGIHEKYYMQLDNGFGALEKLPIVISKPRSLYQIQNQIRQWSHHYGKLGLVVVDYAQLIYVKEYRKEYDRLSFISTELKHIAEECNTNVMCLTQINRMGADQPTMNDIKGSGQFEQDADYIFILHEPDKEVRTPKTSQVDIIVEAHRHGSTGKVGYVYQKDKCRFYDPLELEVEHEKDDLDENFL